MPYTDAFKAQMVKRMMGPSAVNASTLARQVGVSQPTLSQWLRAANRVAAMTPPSDEKKPAPPAGPKKWTPEEKVRVLAAAQVRIPAMVSTYSRQAELPRKERCSEVRSIDGAGRQRATPPLGGGDGGRELFRLRYEDEARLMARAIASLGVGNGTIATLKANLRWCSVGRVRDSRLVQQPQMRMFVVVHAPDSSQQTRVRVWTRSFAPSSHRPTRHWP